MKPAQPYPFVKIRGDSWDSSARGEEGASLSEADRLLSSGRWEEAQALYGEVLKKDPLASSAHFGLGTIAFHQGRYAEAEKHLRQVAPGAPGSRDLPKMLALLRFELAPPPDPKAAGEGPLVQGLAFARGRQYEKALEELLKAMEIDPAARKGVAKDAFLLIIEILGRKSEIGLRFHRRLSALLFP